MCNLFNNHFINVVEEEVLPKIPNKDENEKNADDMPHDSSTFRCKPVDESEINKIIMSFDNKYSTGYDEIPMPVVKKAKQYLLKPLVHLINSSFVSGIFPDKLKVSKVKPIFKKGDKSKMSNYRPVALLPVFSKIYERAMYNRLVEYLESNNLFDKEQHGFRSGRSVITAAVEFIESIINSADMGDIVVALFMDLSKAFDSVSHKVLIKMLARLGIKGPILSWFKSYLTNRKQYVEITKLINNQFISYKSKLSVIKHGVPQGSILGPLLFLCYIKGLPQIITGNGNNKMCVYADDANLKLSGSSMDEISLEMRENLIYLCNFFHEKQLLLNLSKTNFMHFKPKNQERFANSLEINFDNNVIEEVTQTKFLGLIIDSNLKWDLQVDAVAKKVASGLYALYKMASICNLETLKTIYFAYIQSNIAFGISIYGATAKKNLDRLLILQKRAIRIILNLKWRESVKEHFKNLGFMTVYSMYIYESILYIKIHAPNLPILGEYHNYETRSRNNIDTPAHRLKFFEKKTSYAGGKFFNKLPIFIKNENNIFKFKELLKAYLISKPLYSINEYYAE